MFNIGMEFVMDKNLGWLYWCCLGVEITLIVVVVISQTISLRARLQPLGVVIHTHTHSPIQNKEALTKARTSYAVLTNTHNNNVLHGGSLDDKKRYLKA